MDIERDSYGVPMEPAERMQQVMLALFDLLDEADQASFPKGLIGELNIVRLRFMDEFEQRYPGLAKAVLSGGDVRFPPVSDVGEVRSRAPP